jgi:hypothetical protein
VYGSAQTSQADSGARTNIVANSDGGVKTFVLDAGISEEGIGEGGAMRRGQEVTARGRGINGPRAAKSELKREINQRAGWAKGCVGP